MSCSKKYKRFWIILGMVLLVLIVLRETGILDLHLYRSELSNSQASSMSYNYSKGKDKFNVELVLQQGENTLYEHSFIWNDTPAVEFVAQLDPPVYTGNTYLPLMKRFDMTYTCTISNAELPNTYELNGEINGEVHAVIQGFCSRHKALELALASAQDQIISQLKKEFL